MLFLICTILPGALMAAVGLWCLSGAGCRALFYLVALLAFLAPQSGQLLPLFSAAVFVAAAVATHRLLVSCIPSFAVR